jgi:hypothetical protein
MEAALPMRHEDTETDTERKAFVEQIMNSVGRSSGGDLMPGDAADATTSAHRTPSDSSLSDILD